MFAERIREAKPLPDFADSDAYQVALRLRGEIADPRFLNFLYRVGQQPDGQLQTDDLLILDRLRRGESVPGHADATLAGLHRRGIIEREGRGTGVRYVLSPRFYEYAGAAGARVARGTIARAKHKALLLARIAQAANGGISLQDLLPPHPSARGALGAAPPREVGNRREHPFDRAWAGGPLVPRRGGGEDEPCEQGLCVLVAARSWLRPD